MVFIDDPGPIWDRVVVTRRPILVLRYIGDEQTIIAGSLIIREDVQENATISEVEVGIESRWKTEFSFAEHSISSIRVMMYHPQGAMTVVAQGKRNTPDGSPLFPKGSLPRSPLGKIPNNISVYVKDGLRIDMSRVFLITSSSFALFFTSFMPQQAHAQYLGHGALQKYTLVQIVRSPETEPPPSIEESKTLHPATAPRQDHKNQVADEKSEPTSTSDVPSNLKKRKVRKGKVLGIVGTAIAFQGLTSLGLGLALWNEYYADGNEDEDDLFGPGFSKTLIGFGAIVSAIGLPLAIVGWIRYARWQRMNPGLASLKRLRVSDPMLRLKLHTPRRSSELRGPRRGRNLGLGWSGRF